VDATLKLYLVDLVDVAFVAGLEVWRLRQLHDFFEDALSLLWVPFSLGSQTTVTPISPSRWHWRGVARLTYVACGRR
jgi:hypothetical protein